MTIGRRYVSYHEVMLLISQLSMLQALQVYI